MLIYRDLYDTTKNFVGFRCAAAIYYLKMMADFQLLRDYVREKSQEAFAELVRRHVDLVYSAALRQVRSSQLAEEVSQSVFTDLAGAAEKLQSDTILTAWLYQVTRRTAIDVVRRESRRQARERLAVEMAAMNTATDWTQIEPILDDAMEALEESDRAAILLRYFENKSLREVGETLGTSDDAAQKRVSRAVERLREFFSKRGVAIGAGGLAVIVSANAVQAAPVALASTISAAAVVAGTTIGASSTIAATKAIAMTTLQKTIVIAALTAAIGTGLYEARQAAQLQSEVHTLQQQQAPLAEEIQQLQRERDTLKSQSDSLAAENARLKSNSNNAELLTLRGQVAQLRQANTANAEAMPDSSRAALMKSWLEREDKLKQLVQQYPDKTIPEFRLLSEQEWLNAAMDAKFDQDKDIQQTLANLRHTGENDFALLAQPALKKYMEANGGQFPTDLAQLQPYFKSPVDESIFEPLGKSLAAIGILPNQRMGGDWVIRAKTPLDSELDTRWAIGQNGYGQYPAINLRMSVPPSLRLIRP